MFTAEQMEMMDPSSLFDASTNVANSSLTPDGYFSRIHWLNGTTIPYDEDAWHLPFWMLSPAAPTTVLLNYDLRFIIPFLRGQWRPW